MTEQSAPLRHGDSEAGAEIAQLRQVLALVEEIAGGPPMSAEEAALDEAARVSAAYEAALPIVRRRFDTVAAQTAAFAMTGVAALAELRERRRPTAAAAARLAAELRRALAELREIVGANA